MPITSFSPSSGSIFSIGDELYGVQNANEPWSISLTDANTFRFEVDPGDHWNYDPATKERSEIAGEQIYAPGETITVNYQLMVEPGPINTATGLGKNGSWLIFQQLHANDGVSSPPFSVQLVGEKMAVYVGYFDANQQAAGACVYLDPNDIIRGHYYDIHIEVKFLNSDQGFLRVWRDGVQIVNYSGPLGYDNGVYFKAGIYRSDSDIPMAVDIGNLEISSDHVRVVETYDYQADPIGVAKVVSYQTSAPASAVFGENQLSSALVVQGDQQADRLVAATSDAGTFSA